MPRTASSVGALSILLLMASIACAGAPVRRYELYEPAITRHTVYLGHSRPGGYPYNHCASIAFFDGRFHAAWNANHNPKEGQPGQQLLWATSEDGKVWSAPLAFADEAAVKPLNDPEGRQWQPNLINYLDRELWCLWYLSAGRKGMTGTYCSVLGRGRGAKWVTRRIFRDTPFDAAGDGRGRIDPVTGTGFPSQNPVLLPSGRVIVPITIANNGYAGPFKPRWNLVAYTDDGGKTWSGSNLISMAQDFSAQWEPHAFQQADGRLRVFMKNRTRLATPAIQRVLTTVGAGAAKGEPIRFDGTPKWSAMETVSSRLHVIPLASGRFVMLHHDVFSRQRANETRLNLALFFSRTGEDDFVAGPGFTAPRAIGMYPQGIERNGKLHIVYSTLTPRVADHVPRHIECAIVDPVPAADGFYLWPRDKDVVEIKRPRDKNRKLLPYWVRTNKDYTYSRPRAVESDQREAILFEDRASAGVEIDAVHFAAGQSLRLRFDVKITKVQQVGNLVLCSFGDTVPIRIAMPSNRPGALYAYGADQWVKVGAVGLDEWTSLDIAFGRDEFRVKVGGQPAVTAANPMTKTSRRLYLGDGYEVDYCESNRGSQFLIDARSLCTQLERRGD